jgi:uncharacterized surface protein with fasciclin (FAS1) repeats
MVSCGPDTQSYNFTHMQSFVDYRSNIPNKPCVVRGSLYDFLLRNGNFTRFLSIIERAGFIGQLNNEQADLTLFVPPDSVLQNIPNDFFDKMDDGEARQILKASMIHRVIDGKLLKSSPVAYYYTYNPDMRLYITNISGKTRINNCINIVHFDIGKNGEINNGLLHITDGLIVPTMDTFMN